MQIVAVGHLMADFSAQLITNGIASGDWVTENSNITIVAGGTPIHICKGLEQVGGWHTHIVSAVGAHLDRNSQLVPDPLARMLLEDLDTKGIEYSCELVPDRRTGVVILVYPPDPGRLMIADTITLPTASSDYLRDRVSHLVATGEASVVYIAGYLYFDPNNRRLDPTIRGAIGPGNLVWVDVLPHKLYEQMSLKVFFDRIGSIDLLSLDRATLEGFARTGSADPEEIIDRIVAKEVTVAVVEDDEIAFHGPLGRESLPLHGVYWEELARTPGACDVVLSRKVGEYLRSRLRGGQWPRTRCGDSPEEPVEASHP
jgi:sugar/nucleoside kinase (ribokinase family)